MLTLVSAVYVAASMFFNYDESGLHHDYEVWFEELAALIGLMVGLEREHSHQQSETTHFAGIRTFPLMTLLGCTAALLSTEGQPWLFAVGFAGLAVLVLIVCAFSARGGIWASPPRSSCCSCT